MDSLSFPCRKANGAVQLLRSCGAGSAWLLAGRNSSRDGLMPTEATAAAFRYSSGIHQRCHQREAMTTRREAITATIGAAAFAAGIPESTAQPIRRTFVVV